MNRTLAPAVSAGLNGLVWPYRKECVVFSVSTSGPVTLYKMGKSIGRFTLYPVFAFRIGSVLIDTGARVVGTAFLKALADTQKIDLIINTHHHEDHIGNNAAIQKKWHCPILAHENALGYISNPKTIPLKSYQHIVWGRPKKSRVSAVDPVIEIDEATCEVIEGPGHSKDHITLYFAETKWLFTGDLFLGQKIYYLRADEDYHGILSSLNKLCALDVSTLFCSLRGRVDNGNQALMAKRDYMESLRDKVLALGNQGHSPKAIRKKLLGNEGFIFYATSGDFSKQHLVNSILANL